MLNASLLTGGFVGIAVGARYLLAGRHIEEARTMLRMAIALTAVLAPLQLIIGDLHAENTLKYQPTKIAAMEAHWDGSKPAPFELFAWPDENSQSNLYAISLPHIASLLVTRQWNGLFPGLNDVPPQDRPPVPNVFFGFRIMVGDRTLHDRRGAGSAPGCCGAGDCSRRAGISSSWRRLGGSALSPSLPAGW